MSVKTVFKTVRKWLGRGLLLLCVAIGLAMLGCQLPPLQGRTATMSLTAAEIQLTRLGQAAAIEQAKHPELSGLYLLSDPHEAFAARVKLTQQAEKTLDVQYYIWRGDTTGTLLLEALYAAAERGVRVRLLLDDHGTNKLDTELAALDAHPNIEVRLFNPFVFRPFKLFGFVTDFSRANRRMHNKSFTADNAATILGGRNVGDEYFGATDGVLFADLDALAVGSVVPQVSQSFDDYWRSGSAYPLADIVKPLTPEQLAQVGEQVKLVDRSAAAREYKQAILNMAFVQQYLDGQLALEWAPTKFIVDPPSKGLGGVKEKELLLTHMHDAIGNPRQTLDVVSPYFVPTDAGTDYFVGLQKQGIRVRILTNSMAATDVLAVHSGYARHRQRLVDAGIELYELKPDLTAPFEGKKNLGFMGSSGSSLHAKTFGADDQSLFIGSFNFDPRSMHLNTELGIVVQSPKFGQEMDRLFTVIVPQRSWRIQHDAQQGQLQWVDGGKNPPQILTEEPMTTWWQRAGVTFFSWLPIEWLL